MLPLGCAKAAEQFRHSAGKTYEDFIEDDLCAPPSSASSNRRRSEFRSRRTSIPRSRVAFPELLRIIAFRNILAHGYATIDYAALWRLVEQSCRARTNLRMLLGAADTSPDGWQRCWAEAMTAGFTNRCRRGRPRLARGAGLRRPPRPGDRLRRGGERSDPSYRDVILERRLRERSRG